MAQRRRSRKSQPKKEEEFEYIDAEIEDEEADEGVVQRKRSQAEIRLRKTRRKQDIYVVLVSSIIIIATLIGYYYSIITRDTTDSDDEDITEVSGNLTANLHVISDLSHNWTKTSWHIMDVYGTTNYLLKVENTGDLEDTYKLTEDNKIPKITIKFNKNDFTVKAAP